MSQSHASALRPVREITIVCQNVKHEFGAPFPQTRHREYSHHMNDSAHQIEPELLGPTPRALLRRKGAKQNNVAAWMMALAMLAIGAVSAHTAYFTAQTRYRGVAISATITDHSTRHQRNRTSYYLHYRYVWRGREYFDDESVYRDNFEKLRKGDVISVRLSPLRPDRDTYLVFRDGRDTSSMVGLVVGTLLFPFIGVGVLLSHAFASKTQRNLLQNGTPVAARVVKAHYAGLKPAIIYEYAAQPDGKMRRGAARVPGNQLEAMQENYTLTALYDPRKPGSSMIYAFRDFHFAPRD